MSDEKQSRADAVTAPRRGRWQFSLMSLFRMMTLLALLFGLPPILFDARIREERLALRLGHYGASPMRSLPGPLALLAPLLDWKYPGIRGIALRQGASSGVLKLPRNIEDAFRLEEVNLRWDNAPPPDLASLSKLRTLRKVCLSGGSFSEEQFRCLGRCAKLEELVLYSNVDDATLRWAGQVRQLQSLHVDSDREITAAGLAGLASMPRLRALTVRCPRPQQCCSNGIAPVGKAHVGRIASLEVLKLTPLITEEDLLELARLPRLSRLKISCVSDHPEEGIRFIFALGRVREYEMDGPPLSEATQSRMRELGCKVHANSMQEINKLMLLQGRSR